MKGKLQNNPKLKVREPLTTSIMFPKTSVFQKITKISIQLLSQKKGGDAKKIAYTKKKQKMKSKTLKL